MPTIYNKIVLNGQTLIDLSNDTVDSSDDIVEGLVGHLNNGTSVTGTAGGGGSLSDAVRFIDYDGTILHTYSAAEFASLSAMPANPSHAGLTAQGWNWTLSDAKTHVAEFGYLDIGQNYVTDDGKTRIYISLTNSGMLSPYLGVCPNGTVVVDWGDNSATNTLTGTSPSIVQRAQHTYASTGNYVITLTVTSGSFTIYGSNTSSNGSTLLTRTDGIIASQRCYQNAIYKVELGANVTIGSYAFQSCFSLKTITVPLSSGWGNYAFNNCYSLSSITISNGVATIGTYSFNNCYSLVNISIPNTVITLGTYLFSYCTALQRIALPSGVASLPQYIFNYCFSLSLIVLPSRISTIPSYGFAYCYSLTNLTIPSGVKNIGDYAFTACSFANIDLPSTITIIGQYAFRMCDLVSITIPSGVTSINDYTFADCTNLQSVSLPDTVTYIGSYVFSNCYVLENITLPSGLTGLGSNSFSSCRTLNSINIPSGLSAIAAKTFYNCYSLKNLSIPSNIELISSGAFNGCYSLAEITIPDGVPAINAQTCYYCYSLSSVTIPSSVNTINAQAFNSCLCLAEVHLLGTTPPTLASTNAFSGIIADYCKIYVPYSADHSILEAYQTATNWSTYASYMVEESS